MLLRLSFLWAYLHAQAEPILYQIPGRNIWAEFSSLETKERVEQDFKRFKSLPPYKPKKFEDLDNKDPNFGAKVT
jgi:hypothetical protein